MDASECRGGSILISGQYAVGGTQMHCGFTGCHDTEAHGHGKKLMPMTQKLMAITDFACQVVFLELSKQWCRPVTASTEHHKFQKLSLFDSDTAQSPGFLPEANF